MINVFWHRMRVAITNEVIQIVATSIYSEVIIESTTRAIDFLV